MNYNPNNALIDVSLNPGESREIHFSKIVGELTQLSQKKVLFYTINPACETPDLNDVYVQAVNNGTTGSKAKLNGNRDGYFPADTIDYFILINKGQDTVSFPIQFRQY